MVQNLNIRSEENCDILDLISIFLSFKIFYIIHLNDSLLFVDVGIDE